MCFAANGIESARGPGRFALWTPTLLAAAALALAPALGQKAPEPEWSEAELEIIATLTLDKLPPPPPDPSNKYAEDPKAADFGHRLFFDLRFSSNGKVGCVTCHDPEKSFTDGKRFSQGVGVTPRNAPTVIGAAWNFWFLWDGRADNHWAQALAAFENPLEHNMSRQDIVRVLREHADLRRDYETVFGTLPALEDADGVNRAFANIGKALAAYQRHLRPGQSKFDRYAQAILAGREPAPKDQFTLDEREGLHVFISDQRGKCLRCHNGPLFTNQHFHNIGVNGRQGEEHEAGRLKGIETARASPFNCSGQYSDAQPQQCLELRFARRATPELLGAFKTPTLRNLIKTAPYMRDGSQRTIHDVTWHYRDRPAARTGASELENFTITGAEFEQIDAFLRTLEGGIDAPARYLRAPHAQGQ
ncbi:MAG: cytochrome-c peroxidase [Alphaproteobacteria bacterium]|nr:cytochrome-c peroxidase [Alphaproteobacteria bacterium]